ncbi:response regulator transcription factor [Paenibacillus xylaniclasticus]|uniref:response regulator transcription factor n=1 Tax=Paenibacillus xylaniclasticus TaxID=588083 RepID=UPI000FD8AB17|nr:MULTISPECIES: response regulator transcription factor [Paenibacillus]GFN31662.1 hypothetical protein PCURB6_19220 [Paenibacillus curdlanolyticus]
MLAHHYSSMIIMRQGTLLFGFKFMIEQFHFINKVMTSDRIDREELVNCRPSILLVESVLLSQSLELIHELKQYRIINHVIALYEREEAVAVEDYWNSGIVSYLPTYSTQQQLMVAMEGELCGFSVLPTRMAELVELRNASSDVQASLTMSERNVLEQVAGGCTNKEIATSMHLSVRTIETYLSKIYRKLGARNRVEAVAKYWQSPV